MIHSYLPFTKLRSATELSERRVSSSLKISRNTLRQLSAPNCGNVTLSSIEGLASFYDREIEILASPKEILPEYSTIAIAIKIEHDGFDSWKTHFFDFVDEFRRTLDPRLLIMPPHGKFDRQLRSLLAAIVKDLCQEAGINAPQWAAKRYFLSPAWFVSGVDSLKATAILESPLPYRENNIFVHDNFLSRV